MSEERKTPSPFPSSSSSAPAAGSILGLTPPRPAASPASAAAASPRGTVVLPPIVSHSAALSQLAAMFPHLPNDIILFELNQNNRELERTITALLGHSQEEIAAESDEAMARRMQAEMDGESARASAGSSTRGFRLGAGGSHIDEEELTRLKLAQFAHREAIYQTNTEGEFAPKHASAAVTGGSGGSSALKLDHHSSSSHRKVSDKSSARRSQGHGSSGASGAGAGAGAGATLSPMDRIARDRKAFMASGAQNRVASEEELLAAQEGPSAMRALAKKRAAEAEATQAFQALGFTVSRTPSTAPPNAATTQALVAARNNQAALAARQAEAAAFSPYYSAASSSSSALASPSAAASCTAGAGAGDDDSARKEKKKHKKKEKEEGEPHSHKKKKKKEKEEGGSSSDKKKKKKKDKSDPTAASSSSAATAAAPVPSSAAPTVSRSAAAPIDLLDFLPEYSVTRSERHVDPSEVHTLIQR